MKKLTDYEFEDSQEIQKWLFKRGYQLTVNQCFEIWSKYSREVHGTVWSGFMHKGHLYQNVIDKYLLPLVKEMGVNAVRNVFERSGIQLTDEECLLISAKHLEVNKYKGWRDNDNLKEEETFTDKTYKKYLQPIAVELGIIRD